MSDELTLHQPAAGRALARDDGADAAPGGGSEPSEPEAPTLRLSVGGNERTEGGEQRAQAFAPPAPTIRLAHSPGAQGDVVLLGEKGREQLPDGSRPALLVSFFYLKNFLAKRGRWAIRDWALDSGAFSAHNAGAAIDLQEFIATARQLLAEDPQLTEVFALDVIGDWRASERNTDAMWAAGVPAIPAWHQGEPWDVLEAMARDFPKIALGGMVGMHGKAKTALVVEAFSRVWKAVGPKRIHGFGCSGEDLLMRVPFHSVDATNWETYPCRFGSWRSVGGAQLRIRGSRQPLRAEVEWYLALERRFRERWRREMARWPVLPTRGVAEGSTVRLALSGKGRPGVTEALEAPGAPAIRLAVAGAPSGQRAEQAFSTDRGSAPGEEGP